MKKLIVILTAVIALLSFNLSAVHAEDEQDCVSVTQYGGAVGIVCGVKTHEPVDTGLKENLALIGALSVVASGALHYFVKKNKREVEIS